MVASIEHVLRSDYFGGSTYSLTLDDDYIYVSGTISGTSKYIVRKYKKSDLSLVCSTPEDLVAQTGVTMSIDNSRLYFINNTDYYITPEMETYLWENFHWSTPFSRMYGNRYIQNVSLNDVTQDTIYLYSNEPVPYGGRVRKRIKTTLHILFEADMDSYGYAIGFDDDYVYTHYRYVGDDFLLKYSRSSLTLIDSLEIDEEPPIVYYWGSPQMIIDYGNTNYMLGAGTMGYVLKFNKVGLTTANHSADGEYGAIWDMLVHSDIAYTVGSLKIGGLTYGRLAAFRVSDLELIASSSYDYPDYYGQLTQIRCDDGFLYTIGKDGYIDKWRLISQSRVCRVSSIRHTYRPGVYKMQLGFGKLDGLYNYQSDYDKLKLTMRKESVAAATKQIEKELAEAKEAMK
jgi:hypothetical protein